jgi:hypothetical protein
MTTAQFVRSLSSNRQLIDPRRPTDGNPEGRLKTKTKKMEPGGGV